MYLEYSSALLGNCKGHLKVDAWFTDRAVALVPIGEKPDNILRVGLRGRALRQDGWSLEQFDLWNCVIRPQQATHQASVGTNNT